VLLRALSALNPSKREVIVPAYTCPAVASAVLKAGLKLIVADINLRDFGYSRSDLAQRINEKTLAVILVHLFGYPASLDGTEEQIKKQGIWLIEDAAQAFGNESRQAPSVKLGLSGDAGFFSFGRGKPLSILHGGLIVTQSDEIYEQLLEIYKSLKGHSLIQNLGYLARISLYTLFSNPRLYWIPQRLPWLRLGETHFRPDFPVSRGYGTARRAAERMIVFLEEEKKIRTENTQWYASRFQSFPEVQSPPHQSYPYLRYPFRVSPRALRDRILSELVAKGTGAAPFYPTPLNEMPGLAGCLQDQGDYPNAKALSDSLLTLPVHSLVRQRHRERIFNIVKTCLKGLPKHR